MPIHAINALSSIGSPALDALSKLIKEDKYSLREALEQAFLSIGKPSVEALCNVIDRNMNNSSVTALNILNRLGDQTCIPELIKILNDSFWYSDSKRLSRFRMLKRNIYNTLAQLGGDDACRILVKELRESSDENRTRIALAMSAMRVEFDCDIMAIIAVETQDWDKVIALGEISVNPFCHVLHKWNNCSMTDKKEIINTASKLNDDRILIELYEIYKFYKYTVEDIAESILRLNPSEAFLNSIVDDIVAFSFKREYYVDCDGIEREISPNSNMRFRASRELGKLRSKHALPSLIQWAGNDPSKEVRKLATTAITMIENPYAQSTLSAFLTIMIP